MRPLAIKKTVSKFLFYCCTVNDKRERVPRGVNSGTFTWFHSEGSGLAILVLRTGNLCLGNKVAGTLTVLRSSYAPLSGSLSNSFNNSAETIEAVKLYN
jgi:hypothetical protein